MTELVSNALAGRGRDPDGLQRMMAVSAVAHTIVLALIVLAPEGWRGRAASDEFRTVMTISLGGAPGPQAGGMTPLGGRAIQEAAPVPDSPRPEPVRPPAAQPPQMTAPAERTRAAPRSPPPPRPAAAPEARGSTPTRGPETRPGTAVAETGGRGVGFGLTTGGGGGSGSYLDVGDFCCPDYLATMLDLVRRNWNNRQEVPGDALVKFTIQRDGRLTGVALERSSGFAALDLASQRAVLVTQQLPPLPAEFPENQLTVYLNFQYQR